MKVRLSARLKEETAAAHRRLEATPLLRRLMSPLITLDDYRKVIGDFRSVWRLLEPPIHDLDGLARLVPKLNARRRLSALEHDCRLMNATPGRCAARLRRPALPVIEDASAALGCLYMLEGSSLGGLMILRHLEQTLGVGATTGAAFFAGYGRETGAMWRGFLGALDHAPLTRPEQERVTVTAMAVFEGLHDALEEREFGGKRI